MLTLEDFNTSGKKSNAIQDFNPVATPTPTANNATITNVAAHAAMLGSPEEMMGVYSGVTNELQSGSFSATLNNLLEKYRINEQTSNAATVNSVLTNPEISEEEKAQVVQGYMSTTNEQTGSHSIANEVSQAALIAESEPDDNDETEWARIDVGASLREVNEYNSWVNQQITTQANMSNKDAFNSTVNILEMMVPFMEGGAVAKVRSALEGPNAGNILQSLSLLGESKQAVYDALTKMPIGDRKRVAEQLIWYVKNSGGSVTMRPNDLIMLNELQDFLVSGEYSTGDRILDNIFGLMDATIILSPFTGMIRGAVRGGKSATKTVEQVTKATDKVVDAAEPEIKEITDSVIYVNSEGRASSNLDEVQQTVLPAGEETIFVNPRGDASSSLDAVAPPPLEETKRAADLIVERVMEKFKLPEGTRTPSSDMGVMLDDIGIENASGLRQDLIRKVNEILTPETASDISITKRITAGIKEVVIQNGITPSRTFSPTTAQLIRKSMNDSAVTRRSVRTEVKHTSVSQTFVRTNPSRARKVHELARKDTTGNMAKVLYGTNRTEAMANDVLPEIAEADGAVRNKVSFDDEAAPRPSDTVVKAVKEAKGDIHFSDAEKVAMRNAAKSDFKNVVGLNPRTEMSSIGDEADGVKFSMVYGPRDGGFRSAKQAKDQVKFALKKYGVTDNEIELIARDTDGNYRPPNRVDLRDGNYLVRVNHHYEFSPADTINWTLSSSKSKFWRMFDMVTPFTSGRSGGLREYLAPASVVVDKLTLDAASVASDVSAYIKKMLIEVSRDYAKKFKRLNNYQQNLVHDYIIEANNKSLKFDPANLRARGMNEDAIDTVRSWKKTNDTMYYFENQDLNKTLRAKGYEYFIDTKNNTKLIVKNLSKRQLQGMDDVSPQGIKAYDSESDKIVTMTWDEYDVLANDGGNIASVRGTVEHGDDAFDLVIVKNKSESSYTRRIRDDDATLNYRDGHYTVRYTDPYFITKKFKKNGKEYTKAIATSGSLKDAEAFLNRLKATDEAGEYNIRGNLRKDANQLEEAEWSSMVSSGRTSQRIRGDRLANATGQQTDPAHIHIESPEESLVRSILSLSNRVAHRDFIESAKARWMNQFEGLVPKQNGKAMWPNDVRDIARGDITTDRGRLSDARAAWRYIEAIDSGYVNLLDDFSKGFFKNMSETAGRKGWGWLETAAGKAAEFGPTTFARKKAFRLLLAANPIRQVMVQAMQALPVIMAMNPKFALSGRLASQFSLIRYLQRGGDAESFMKTLAEGATGLTAEEAKQLAKHYEQSGFEAAVSAHSYIRDDIKNLVDTKWYHKVGSALATPLNVAQKFGFELGENALMRSVWLSEYDLLRRSGKQITKEDLQRMNARVRHLTLNMNRAGELPYNENMFSAAAQFWQAPHKAISQILMGHNGLSGMDRLKLGAAYVLTYGVGVNWLSGMIAQVLPVDPKLKETIEGGIFNLAVNKMLSTIYGDDVEVDFSDSLRLLDVGQPFKFWQALMDMNIPEALTASPSASLVFGDSPRVTNFVKQLMRPFTVSTDKTGEEIYQTGVSFLTMFSGASNFFKAKYILENQKAISGTGTVVDPYVNNVEALMRIAGFSTIDEINQYAFNEKTYQATQAYKNDINLFITEASRRLASKGIANDEAEYYLDMMSEAQRVFENNPFYMKEIQQQLTYRAVRGETDIFKTVLRLGGYLSYQELRDVIINAPVDKQKQEGMLKIIEFMKGSQ